MSVPIQTAVVTGASRGFGRAIAAALVAAGTGVVGIARIPSGVAVAAQTTSGRCAPSTPSSATASRSSPPTQPTRRSRGT